jgi:peptidoglycan/xylan/chitin deacetylase (PgdA/CDA1 family)
MRTDALRALLPFAGHWLRPHEGELPILMYHKVKPTALDPWTVSVAELDRQFAHLNSAGYRSISCRDLANDLNRTAALPAKPVLITFDDGYANNLLHACPLLERHGLRATMFLPVKFIGGENEWDGGGELLLGYDQLRAMSPEVVEFGLHSYAHGNYRRMSLGELEADLRQCIAGLERNELPFVRALAYPFGRDPARRCFRWGAVRTLLTSLGIECGLRIGNRVNRLPITNRYSLQRIDIRGDDTLETFCRKLEGRSTDPRVTIATLT